MSLFSIWKNYCKHRRAYFFVSICLFLFFIPFISSPGYSLGGDDSRLYYLYPKEYLTNYLFQVMSANGPGGNMGYMAVSYGIPVIGFVFLIKTILPMVNVQHVFYGLNLSLGFIFCFLFFRIHNKTGKNSHILAAILASCLYITSPYLVKTIFQNAQLMIYLVMLTPLFLYTFTRGLEERNIKYIVGSALGVALFSSSLLSISWFIPLFLVCIPYFMYCIFRYKFFFWKSIAVFILVSIGLHWYWLVHGLVSIISSRLDKTIISLIVSKQFVQDSGNAMYSTIFLNGSMHQIAGYMRTSWQDHKPMPSWNLIGSISLLLISLAGLQIKKTTKQIQILFIVILFSLGIALFMITPNMGKWNMDVFLYFNRTIPLFSMFRNMNSKFGLAYGFISAWAVFLSLIILSKAKQKLWRWIPFGLGIILLIYQLPSFLRVQGIGGPKSYITELSHEYMQLVQYISTFDTTKRFVWYPMTFPGYTPIQDQVNKDSWYLGLSPLQILVGKSDVAGFYGIQTPIDPNRNWKILELFKQKKYEEVVSILASYNIGYVITQNEKLPDPIQKQLDLFSFVFLQGEEYKKILLGEKISDFGGAYSLYTINPEYAFDTVFLTDNLLDIHAPKEAVSYRRIKTNVYDVTLSPKTESQSLVLLTPYHALWNVSIPKAHSTSSGFTTGEDSILLTNHRVAYDYGNAWDIQRKAALTGPVTLTIEFIPDKLTMPSIMVSSLVFISCCIYICYPKKRK